MELALLGIKTSFFFAEILMDIGAKFKYKL